MKIKSIYYSLFVSIVIITFSCKIDKKENNRETKNIKDTVVNPVFNSVTNEVYEIGEVDLIYMFYEYWDGRGNITLGVNGNSINNRVMELFPDTINSIQDLPYYNVPQPIYVNQTSLNYLAEYMIDNCDTVIYHDDIKNGEPIFNIIIIGKNGKIECLYGEPIGVKKYFKGMKECIKKFGDKNLINSLIPRIEPMTK